LAIYVELRGYKQHDNQWTGQNDPSKLSLKEIASQFGISEKSLKRLLSIENNLTDSMKELMI
jgi:AraC-like DNA-binding protein